jgi:hypothetical protein
LRQLAIEQEKPNVFSQHQTPHPTPHTHTHETPCNVRATTTQQKGPQQPTPAARLPPGEDVVPGAAARFVPPGPLATPEYVPSGTRVNVPTSYRSSPAPAPPRVVDARPRLGEVRVGERSLGVGADPWLRAVPGRLPPPPLWARRSLCLVVWARWGGLSGSCMPYLQGAQTVRRGAHTWPHTNPLDNHPKCADSKHVCSNTPVRQPSQLKRNWLAHAIVRRTHATSAAVHKFQTNNKMVRDNFRLKARPRTCADVACPPAACWSDPAHPPPSPALPAWPASGTR